MQFNNLDPLLFLLAILGFFTLFTVIMYSKGLMWFQQTGTNATDNWFVSFESRDIASGSWFRRFGRPPDCAFSIPNFYLYLCVLYPHWDNSSDYYDCNIMENP